MFKAGIMSVLLMQARKGGAKQKMLKGAFFGMALGTAASVVLMGAAKASGSGTRKEVPEEYVRYCKEAGEAYQICPELLEAVMEAESGGNPDVIGVFGELGLMQVYPKYHAERAERLGVFRLSDPMGSVFIGADYLAELFLEYEDVGTVLMLYNGTKDAVERGRKGDYTDYAKKVMERARQLERLRGK